MGWTIEATKSAGKKLKRLDKVWRLKIIDYLQKCLDNPRAYGKPLSGDKRGLWRYRVGSYRVLCELQDDRMKILLVELGHRKDVYD